MKRSWQISRRTMLRGGSIAIALPFLEQMIPASRKAAKAQAAAKRYVVMYKPVGSNVPMMTPGATGTGYTLPSSLMPLAPLQANTVVVTGLQNSIVGDQTNFHLGGMAGLLTSVRPTRDKIGISLDQALANDWRGRTSLPSLELGSNMSSGEFKNQAGLTCEGLPCTTAWTLSYVDDKTLKPTEISPQAAFDRLFAGGLPPAPMTMTDPTSPTMPTTPGPAPDVEKLRAYRKSILDYVRAQATGLKTKLGAGDQRRMDNYLTSVRELEMRIAALPPPSPTTSPTPTTPTAPAPAPMPSMCKGNRPSMVGTSPYPDRIKAMIDVITLAFQCDATRIVTYMMAEGESEYTFPGVAGASGDGHHGTSHHGGNASQLNRVAAIDKWYVGHVAALATKLKAIAEPGGSILDNTVIFHSSEVSDGDSHSFIDMPIVLVGGAGAGLPSGRHIRAQGRALADLHLAILQGLGSTRTSWGNSTGPLSLTG